MKSWTPDWLQLQKKAGDLLETTGQFAKDTSKWASRAYTETNQTMGQTAKVLDKRWSDYKVQQEQNSVDQAIKRAKDLSQALKKLNDRLVDDLNLSKTLIRDLAGLKEQHESKRKKYIQPLNKGLNKRYEETYQELCQDHGRRMQGIYDAAEQGELTKLNATKSQLDDMINTKDSNPEFNSRYAIKKNKQAVNLFVRIRNAQKPLQINIVKAQAIYSQLMSDIIIFQLIDQIKTYFKNTNTAVDHAIIANIFKGSILIDSEFEIFRTLAGIKTADAIAKYQSIVKYAFALRRIEVLTVNIAYQYEQHWDGSKPIETFEGSDLANQIEKLKEEMSLFKSKKAELEEQFPNTQGTVLPDDTQLSMALNQNETGLLSLIDAHFGLTEKREQEKQQREQQMRQQELEQQIRTEKGVLQTIENEISRLNLELSDPTVNIPALQETSGHFENQLAQEIANVQSRIKQQQIVLAQLQDIKQQRAQAAEQQRQQQEQAVQESEKQLEEKQHRVLELIESLTPKSEKNEESPVTTTELSLEARIQRGLKNVDNVDMPKLKETTAYPGDTSTIEAWAQIPTWEKDTIEGRKDLADRKTQQMQSLIESLKQLQKEHQAQTKVTEPKSRQTSVAKPENTEPKSATASTKKGRFLSIFTGRKKSKPEQTHSLATEPHRTTVNLEPVPEVLLSEKDQVQPKTTPTKANGSSHASVMQTTIVPSQSLSVTTTTTFTPDTLKTSVAKPTTSTDFHVNSSTTMTKPSVPVFKFNTQLQPATHAISGMSPFRPNFEKTTLEQKVNEKVVMKYEQWKGYYAKKGYIMGKKLDINSLGKRIACRSGTRNDMVNFIDYIKENASQEQKELLLYHALLIVKNSIESKKPRYTSTLWCIAKELTQDKKINKDEAKSAFSTFWNKKSSESTFKSKRWNVEKAINDLATSETLKVSY